MIKKQYHVGELAGYFGISSDTLRLYDKKGILSPRKNDENGYRVYTRADLLCLEYILRLKQIGLGLDEIRLLVNSGSIGSALKAAQEQSLRLEERMERMRLLLETTVDYENSLRSTIESLDSISVCMSPRMICRRLDISMTETMTDFKRLAPGRLPRMTYITPKDIVLSDIFESALASCDAASWDLSHALVLIDEKNEVEVPSRLMPYFEVFESRKCVYGSIKCYTGRDYSAYTRMKSYMLENGLSLCGHMISVSATVRNNTRDSVDYYQVWLPVE